MQAITPLHKHHGQHGPLIALAVIIGASILVVGPSSQRALDGNVTKRARIAVPGPPRAAEVTSVAEKLVVTAVVGYAEEVTAHVRTPVPGFIVSVPRTGHVVKRGAPLATLYSPDVLHAERELIAQVKDFTTQDLLNDARRKLQRMGMPPAWIARVEKTGVPQGTLPVWAWTSGTVVANQLLPGLYVESMTELVTITDPKRRWVLVEVDDADRARLTVGMAARLYIDGRATPVPATIGRVSRRYVRFEFTNPKPSIAPETPVRVELDFMRT
jgi:hypothetical protein